MIKCLKKYFKIHTNFIVSSTLVTKALVLTVGAKSSSQAVLRFGDFVGIPVHKRAEE